MKHFVVWAWCAVIAAAVAACGGEAARLTPTAVPTERALATASTDAAALGGWAISAEREGMFATRMDGSGARVRLTAGMAEAGAASYAGYVAGDDETWVYVTQIIGTEPPAPSGLPMYTARVLRTSLARGEREEVLRFSTVLGPGDEREAGTLTDAAVARDGAYIVYADGDAVWLLDAGDGSTRALLETNCPRDRADRPEKGCFDYRSPLLSARGDLLLTKQEYEGSRLVLVRGLPDAPAVREYDRVGADTKSWSNDGQHFCAMSTLYEPGGVFVGDVDGSVRQIRPREDAAGEAWPAVRCLWSVEDALWVVLARPVEGGPGRELRASIHSDADFPNALNLALGSDRDAVDALAPNGPFAFMSGVPRCEPTPCGEEERRTAVVCFVSIDCVPSMLPPIAGRVVAIVPTN